MNQLTASITDGACTYDAAGNLFKKLDAKGVLVTYEYDSLNRLTGVHFPDPSKDITYTYDSTANGNFGIGRMTGMSDPSGTTAYSYDEYGALLREVRSFTGGPSLTTEYAYDANGNTETMAYPDGRVVHYEHDDADRVSRVWSVKLGTIKDHASDIKYAPFGPVLSYTYGNGLKAVRTYDLDYRLRHLKSGPMVRRDYGYDFSGNITSISDMVNPAKSQVFTYDALDRLRTALGAYGTKTYSYDAVGTRIGDGNEDLLFDENGNVETDGVLSFEYEAGAPIGFNPGSDEVGIYGYAGGNPVKNIDPTGENAIVIELVERLGPEAEALIRSLINATAVIIGAIISKNCEKKCPECQPYPKGTIGYIGPHTDHGHFPIPEGKPHLNLWQINQRPSDCKCTWNKLKPAAPMPPLPRWVNCNNGFPLLTP